MEKLDLIKINSSTSYLVTENSQDGFYIFVADSGAEFSVGFMPDDLIQSDDSYEFIIGNALSKEIVLSLLGEALWK